MPLYIHTFSLAVWYMRIVCPFGEANERVVAVCVCVCVCVCVRVCVCMCVCVCVAGMSGLRQRVVGAWLKLKYDEAGLQRARCWECICVCGGGGGHWW